MLKLCINNLKSNMDRFIVEKLYFRLSDSGNLKSNMDRFIVFIFHKPLAYINI